MPGWSQAGRAPRAAVLALALVLAVGGSAAADTIRVEGDLLRGRVVELTPDGLHFEPVYGEGVLVVPYGDLEEVRTDGPLVVLYADAGEAHGRLLGFEAGRLRVGDAPDTAREIDVDTLFRAYPAEGAEVSLYERLRRRFRYWSASLDAGAALVQSTTDNSSAFLRLRIEQDRTPTRLLVDGSARYATENPQDGPRDVTENVLTGRVRGEYDLSERLFAFASNRATHDGDQHIALRLEPRGGLGVHILDRETLTLSADISAAWIYEDFFGKTPVEGMEPRTESRGRDNFWTVAFGVESEWELPAGALLRASGDYLPAVDAPTENYILRGESSIELPLLDWLSFDVAAIDEYNNSPAEDSERNKLTFTAGLSLRF